MSGGGGTRAEAVQGHVHRAVSSRTGKDITVKVRDCHDAERPPGRPRARLRRRRVASTQKTTNSSGVVKFRLKPTQLKKVTFRVSKLTYATVYIDRRVYRP